MNESSPKNAFQKTPKFELNCSGRGKAANKEKFAGDREADCPPECKYRKIGLDKKVGIRIIFQKPL